MSGDVVNLFPLDADLDDATWFKHHKFYGHRLRMPTDAERESMVAQLSPEQVASFVVIVKFGGGIVAFEIPEWFKVRATIEPDELAAIVHLIKASKPIDEATVILVAEGIRAARP